MCASLLRRIKIYRKKFKKDCFAEDLFHRLNVIPIAVPPLRDRRDDIPLLAAAFVEEFCLRNGMAQKRLSDGAAQILKGMAWKGNVRELRNTIERSGDYVEQ